MPLTVTSRVENEIGLLILEGPLTLGPSLQALRETTRQMLADSKLTGIVLDVSGLTGADSAGLGELTVVYTLASRQGCRVALAKAKQSLLTMLQVTHLDGLLPAADSLPAAKSLVSGRG